MPAIATKKWTRKKWKNYVSDQFADPLKYFKPSSLQELIAVVCEAKIKDYKLKAIGSGHSSSDIGITRDYMIDTHSLNRVLDKNQLELKGGDATGDLFFVE